MDKSIANAERTAVVLEAELAALIGGAAAGAEPPVTADPGLAKLRETYSKLQWVPSLACLAPGAGVHARYTTRTAALSRRHSTHHPTWGQCAG